MFSEAAANFQARHSLLTEVDFKWLMAGQGQWIDTVRFHDDAAYASGLIDAALSSPSFALRECAVLLKTQIAGKR